MNHKTATTVVLALAIAAAVGIYFRTQHAAPPPAITTTRTGTNALPDNCCGQRMDVEGEIYTWEVPDGKAVDGTQVPEDCRAEAYGNVMVARATLPAGRYTVEIIGSENSFPEAGKRIFDVNIVRGDQKQPLAENVDLFQRAGGAGKPYTIEGAVDHPGGTLRIVFTPRVDFPKFSTIRILDAQGNKAAWVFAKDLASVLKLPGEIPVVTGPELWKDAASPTDARVADLIKRMTLREKVWQLSNSAPAIDRLGLPAYNYWSEALHGVARNGVATVFPQAIGMAATFDAALVQKVGDTIATEARAKFNAAHAPGAPKDDFGGLFRGLTFWSPNINLFRDPRWGRGHETYGEDPLLTGTIGVAFIRGLQGDDPKYLKVVATAKHYAVHSGPEMLRHVFNAVPPERDFYESYLPQFEMAVRDGHVSSVMGAYNRVFGDPACDSPLLLKRLLRDGWGFDGYVVSDCNAITDIWAHHKVVPDQAQAAADAVKAGTDLECGRDYGSLAAAVDLKLLDEAAIDRALARVLTSRFRLGLFDPPASVRYAAIPATENDTAAHEALALDVARASIVLLKNDGTLPLKPAALKRVAVVGPNADGLLGLLGNYNGTPSRPITLIAGLRATLPGVEIVHIKCCDNAQRLTGDWQLLPDVVMRAGGGAETGFRAEFFPTDKMDTPPAAVRTEKSIDIRGLLEWTLAPAGATPPAAIRFTGEFVAPAAGTYRIGVTGASPYRFIVNGTRLADVWENGTGDATAIGAIGMNLTAGQRVPVIVEARPTSGMLDLQLLWDHDDAAVAPLVAEQCKNADVILFAAGIDGHMEAEEGDVRAYYRGFLGGDRETIELPAVQTTLLKALAATGKPVVLVNMSGSAMAMPWEKEHLNAILQAWYPGEAGGRAIADVLVGNTNPSGRLPVTFYASTGDLPEFTDYAMAPGKRDAGDSLGRTYRYFTGTPLWTFGFGLSYTTFTYADIKTGADRAKEGDTITLQLTLRNTGPRHGTEVVQVYAEDEAAHREGDPRRRLVGFARVPLAAAQSTAVEIAIPVARLRYWDPKEGSYILRKGPVLLKAGASAADLRGQARVVVE